MPSDEPLGTYLNDHLAGAAAGVELAEKLGANYEGTPLGTAVAAWTSATGVVPIGLTGRS